jgi:hypothetical protein
LKDPIKVLVDRIIEWSKGKNLESKIQFLNQQRNYIISQIESSFQNACNIASLIIDQLNLSLSSFDFNSPNPYFPFRCRVNKFNYFFEESNNFLSLLLLPCLNMFDQDLEQVELIRKSFPDVSLEFLHSSEHPSLRATIYFHEIPELLKTIQFDFPLFVPV